MDIVLKYREFVNGNDGKYRIEWGKSYYFCIPILQMRELFYKSFFVNRTYGGKKYVGRN